MSDRTSIAWTDATWNPVRGCTKVSTGCKNCYAERFAERWRGVKGHPFEQGFDICLVPEALNLPLRWRKPRHVFVNSMSDLFHPNVPDEFLDRVFSIMARAKQCTFQVLTKRPERMRRYLKGCHRGADDIGGRFPWPNIWLGVSVEDQHSADKRIPLLLDTPAAIRFVSCEPLLTPLQVARWLGPATQSSGMHDGVDWVIVGGESGPGARSCDIGWIRSIAQQCRVANVPVFIKQLGASPEGNMLRGGHLVPIRLYDRKGADPAEWPEDLRLQEFPEVRP